MGNNAVITPNNPVVLRMAPQKKTTTQKQQILKQKGSAAQKTAARSAPDLHGCRKQGWQWDGDRHGLVGQRRVVKDPVRDEEVSERGVDGVQEGRQQHQGAGELLPLAWPVQLRPPQAVLRTHVLQGRAPRGEGAGGTSVDEWVEILILNETKKHN